MAAASSFDVEEEFDPALLGLLGPPVQAHAIKPPARVPFKRAASSKYLSADWSPDDPDVEQEAIKPKLEASAKADEGISAKDLLESLLASVNAPLLAENKTTARPNGKARDDATSNSELGAPSPTAHRAIPIASGASARSNNGSQLGESLDSGIQTDVVSDSEISTGPSRHTPLRPLKPKLDVRLVAIRRKGKRGYRLGVRVRKPADPGQRWPSHVDERSETLEVELPPEPVKYDSLFQENLAIRFGKEALEKLDANAVADASTGYRLPHQTRELVSSLTDLKTAVSMANELRASIGAPPLSMRTNKIALRKSVAITQTKLYTEIAAALILPSAPEPSPQLWEADKAKEKPALQFTPSSLEIMSRKLPEAFPHEAAAIKAFLETGKRAAYGEEGNKVLWETGIGRMAGKVGTGFREKAIQTDSPVHIFVDHSNILYGLLTGLQQLPASGLPPKHLRIMSLPCMSLLLRRGRDTPPGSMHLVASSPLKQDLDPLVRLGWEVSVMKRVEIYEDEVLDPAALKLVARPQLHVHGPNDGHVGLKRFREQGVDEILHLKLLQALNTKSSPAPRGSTIVLATGDARGGQFNRDGFLGAVREALKRGWAVELWSWKSGLSRSWIETAKREKWNAAFGIHLLDDWVEQLVEVAQEETD